MSFSSKQRTLGLVLALLSAGAVAEEGATYLQSAEDYLSRHDYKAAVIQLKNALQQNPNHMEARHLLAKAYLDQGNAVAAEKEIGRALELGLAPEKGLPMLGRVYLMQGKAEELLRDLQVDGVTEAKSRAIIHAFRGHAQLQLQATDKARQAYDAALELSANLPEALLGQAKLALAAKDLDAAMDYVKQVLAADPDSVDGLMLKGDLLFRSDDAEAALQAFSKAQQLMPSSFRVLLGKAMAEVKLRKFDTADESLKLLLNAAPDHPIVNYFNALVLFQRQNLDGAESALNKVLNRAPGHLQSLLLLGVINYQQNELEQAEYHLSRFVTEMPGHLPGRKVLAAVYIKLKQPQQAIATLDVIQEHDADAQLLTLLGTAYMQSGDSDKGTEYLQQAAELAPDMAAVRAQLALGRLASGEADAAVSELEMAVDLGQDMPMADILLVYAHLRQQAFEKAIAVAEKLVEKHPDSPMALNVLGVSHANAGDFPEAKRQFEKALQVDSEYAAAYMGLGELAERQEQPEVAKQHYQGLLKLDADHIGAMLALARLAGQQGDTDGALVWLNKAREANPEAPQPMVLLANLYLSQGEPLKALPIAREAYSLHPRQPIMLTLLGKAQMASGEQSSAQGTFEELVELQPDSVAPLMLLAQAQISNERFEAAAQTLEKAIQLADGDNIVAHMMLGRVAIQLEQYERAKKLALALQQDQPALGAGYELEGDVQAAEGRINGAIKAYRTAFAKAKSSGRAVKLHRALKQAGETQAAVVPLEEWLDEQPQDVSSRLMLAMTFQNTGDLKNAIKHYEKILDVQPENIVVLNNLAWVYQEQGDNRAQEYADRAYRLAPQSPEVVDTAGWVFVQNGRVDKGLKLLQDAKIHAPHIPAISYHYAVALHKSGRSDEARRELRQLLRDHDEFADKGEAERLLSQLQ